MTMESEVTNAYYLMTTNGAATHAKRRREAKSE